ncbi:hypothetical protein [Cupriavidus sp. USMAHM13]|uniref:hypothetical protein n=1 Tax=Cupriavidus sp. USMAHM13 TaxID=1389192 RepID=UPI001E311367|nr:hypothetical protein [Cupriavidus sp. USMAHM13]
MRIAPIMSGSVAGLLATCLLTACETPLLPTPPAVVGAPRVSSGPGLPQVAPTPIPQRDIELAGECRRTEEDGFHEEALMRVAHNAVEVLIWNVQAGRHGTCHFDLREFHQVRQTPHVELQAVDGSACKLMVWQDPRRITLAFAQCESHCTPGAYEHAWPVLFDPESGSCAQIR